jgi:Uma2 family endonuclease
LNRIRGKKVIDLTVDPPPDIAIEIEITHTILDRISILQALGVAEIWRFDGVTIRVLVLRDGAYHEQQRSPSFPQVPLSKLVDFVHQAEQLDETTLLREFQAWIREQVACGWK